LAQRILPEADVQRMLILEPKERNRALLTLLYASGCRVSEVCGLKWQDLQATPKLRQRGDRLRFWGRETRPDRFNFLSPYGNNCSVCAVKPILKTLFFGRERRSDTCGRMRHTVLCAERPSGRELKKRSRHIGCATRNASHALDRGAPIHLVQATLGHASLATTSRYLRLIYRPPARRDLIPGSGTRVSDGKQPWK
jgi:site-specific recombinase XerD